MIEYKDVLKKVKDIEKQLEEEVLKLLSANMTPDYIICDAEHYYLLRVYMYSVAKLRFIQDGIVGMPTDDFQIKKISVHSIELTVVQRLDKTGINVYGRPIS